MTKSMQIKRGLVAAFIWLNHGTKKDQRKAALSEVKSALKAVKVDPYNFTGVSTRKL